MTQETSETKTRLRILTVEDSEDDAELMIREVRRGNFDPIWKRVETAKELSQALEEQEWDILISDFAMPSFSGLEALTVFKSYDLDIPFILVSGTIGEELAVEAMKAGAHDYIMKDKMQRLVPAIERELREAAARKQHKLTQAALRQSERRFRNLFETMREAYLLIDEDNRILSANPAAAKMVGLASPSDLFGRSFVEFLAAPEQGMPFLETIETQGYCDDLNIVLLRQDSEGERRHAHGSAVAAGTESGRGRGIELILSDITKKKQLEEQLLQSQKMEAVGRLAGGIAHDFNNLLTVIIGNAEFGMMGISEQEPVYGELLRVQKAARQASELTGQLLTFSRRQVLKPAVLDLNETIENHVKLLGRIIGEDIKFSTELSSDISRVFADQAQLQQVLMNLCVNARDAMPKGGKLTIATGKITGEHAQRLNSSIVQDGANEDAAEEYVELRIEDNGHGMSEMTQKHIFEPFFTTKAVGKGTGLGLAVVYGIVQQHRGLVEVDSELERGTTFRLYLPALSREQNIAAGSAESEQAPEGAETILVVEDEEAVHKVITRILSQLGYSVLSARDGNEALKVFKEDAENIDLVIVDVIMPEISGPDTYKLLADQKPGLPVLYVTGYDAHAELTSITADEQTLQILHKPFTRVDLGRKVREVLDVKKSMPTASQGDREP